MAVTVAKMITVFMNIPLYTISTLKLMASGSKGKTLAIIDARRGNSFGMLYDMDNNKYIIEEALYNTEELKNNAYDNIVTESDYRVDPIYCLNNKTKVENPDLLIPNYLRETEAERNLND
jgi:tRNA threonylcarbamoyladenosine biosynthesis protein TsaB